MPTWKTQDVINGLKNINGVKKIENSGPGGDVDSDNLVLHIDGTKERLFVCAFNPEMRDNNPSNDEFTMVEVSDGTDSKGGLQTLDEKVGEAYYKVRRFFGLQGFQVVTCLKDYF